MNQSPIKTGKNNYIKLKPNLLNEDDRLIEQLGAKQRILQKQVKDLQV